MQVANDKVVAITYVLTDDDGEVLETAERGDELLYLHGRGHLPEGLEDALAGKSVGDKFKVDVPAEKGFGEYDESMVQDIPREEFGGVDEIEVGMQFEAETDDGPQIVTVVSVEDDKITVDGNHEFAGYDLHYEVEVIEVREPTPEELEHGHAHGEGCEDDWDEEWDDDDVDFGDDDEDEKAEGGDEPKANLN